jgi:hypothetical protein
MLADQSNSAVSTAAPRIAWASRASLVLALALALAGAVCCWSAVAQAGEWMQVSCVNPDQSGASSQGWSSFSGGAGVGSNNGTGCGPGAPMFGLLSSAGGVGTSANETLRYTPPAGSVLDGGTVDVALSADGRGYNASGTAVLYTPEYTYDASNVLFQCAAGLSPCSSAGNDYTGQIAIPAGRGGNLYVSAGCGGAPGASCSEGASNGAWSSVQLWWANLRLSNSSTPAASAIGGTLLEPGARGMQDITFTATDNAGPGVYRSTVQADGQTLYSATPDTNGGQCVPVGSSGGALMFDASQPCRQSESVDEAIDTTLVKDGRHTLKVTVQDAAGNSSVIYDATITTQNAPANTAPPSLSGSAGLLPGVPVHAQAGQWTAPAGAGAVAYSYQWERCDAQGGGCQPIPSAQAADYTPEAADSGRALRVLVSAADNDGSSTAESAAEAVTGSSFVPQLRTGADVVDPLTARTIAGPANGAGASEGAQLRLSVPARSARAFAHRTLALSGQLLSASGAPIAGGVLDIREQAQGSASPVTIAHATSAANGSFTAAVGPGPSRAIVLAYRAHLGDSGYSAQAIVQESVAAGVQMHVTPRRTGSSGTIALSGVVAGPIPRQGVVVELLVRYRGRWEPLRTPRTGADGRFKVPYQFQGALGRFPFRAEVFGGQSGFPYETGHSEAVSVITR